MSPRPGRFRRAVPLRDRVLLTTYRAVLDFVRDRGHRAAAQMSFFAVLSAVPLAMLVVALFGLVFDDAEVRRRVVETTFDAIPVAQEGDRKRLEDSTLEALDNVGQLGPVTIGLLIVSASGVMGALRHAINVAWDLEERRALIPRKLLDVALVSGATILMLVSLSLSVTREAAQKSDDEGSGGAVLAFGLNLLADLLPFLAVLGVLLFAYRVLPAHGQRLRAIWPGAVVGALGLLAAKAGLELYLERLGDLGAIYGSLGALIALGIFVFIAAMVIVFGAEFAAEWSRLPDDDDEVGERVREGRRRIRSALPGRSVPSGP